MRWECATTLTVLALSRANDWSPVSMTSMTPGSLRAGPILRLSLWRPSGALLKPAPNGPFSRVKTPNTKAPQTEKPVQKTRTRLSLWRPSRTASRARSTAFFIAAPTRRARFAGDCTFATIGATRSVTVSGNTLVFVKYLDHRSQVEPGIAEDQSGAFD